MARRRKAARRRRSSGGRRTMARRITESLQGGLVDAAILYPASKLVWAFDQMARNFLPVGFPQAARTPAVTVLLSMIPSAVVDDRLADRIGGLTMAAGLVQTIQQFGATATTPGPIDAAMNKLVLPIAEVGMSGYTMKMNGYVTKMQGYTTQSLKGGRRPTLRGMSGWVVQEA